MKPERARTRPLGLVARDAAQGSDAGALESFAVRLVTGLAVLGVDGRAVDPIAQLLDSLQSPVRSLQRRRVV